MEQCLHWTVNCRKAADKNVGSGTGSLELSDAHKDGYKLAWAHDIGPMVARGKVTDIAGHDVVGLGDRVASSKMLPNDRSTGTGFPVVEAVMLLCQ